MAQYEAPTRDDIETARLVIELNDSMEVETTAFVRDIAAAEPLVPPSMRAEINGWPAAADAKDLPIIASTEMADRIEAAPDGGTGQAPTSLRPVLMTDDIYQMVLREELRYLTDSDGDVERVRVLGRSARHSRHRVTPAGWWFRS